MEAQEPEWLAQEPALAAPDVWETLLGVWAHLLAS